MNTGSHHLIPADAQPVTFDPSCPIMICLLGNFRLLKAGQPVALTFGSKVELLLSYLALRHGYRVRREELLEALWPNSGRARASESLKNMVYKLHRSLGDQIGGAAPVLHENGYYRLHVEAGICVDVACFDALADAGDQETRAGACRPRPKPMPGLSACIVAI
jgi:DNA-binding SARP family transcriptional activator